MAPFVQQDPPLFNGDHTTQRTSMERSSMNTSMPIAIISMSCKCPGDVTSPERLWQLCADGRSAWSDIPQNRFNAKAFYHPKGEKLGAVSTLYCLTCNSWASGLLEVERLGWILSGRGRFIIRCAIL